MALDVTFGLFDVAPQPSPHLRISSQPEISRLFRNNSQQHWALRVTDDGLQTLSGETTTLQPATLSFLRRLFSDRWLVFRNCTLEKFEGGLLKLQSEGGNGYAILEQAGIVIVSPGKVSELTGGSYCQLSLQQLGSRITVYKRIDLRRTRGLIDADLKLRREEQWLRKLPLGAKHLFPRRRQTTNGADEFGYVSDFAHGYTISERLFQGTLSEVDARETIAKVFSALVKSLYGKPFRRTHLSCMEVDYPSRIERRFGIIRSQQPSVGGLFREVLAAPRLVINDVACLGVESLIRLAQHGNWIDRYLPAVLKERSHGDLILDDIVIDNSREFFLLDPNGDSPTRLYDVGKMFLSLLSYYEFFKYDRFHLDVDRSRRTCEIHLTVELAAHPARNLYRGLAVALPSLLGQTKVLGEDGVELSGIGLLLLNGLQNLSLPMFHLLHHHAEQRALAFLAIGVLQLMQVNKTLNQSLSPSLEEIIERTSLF